MPKTIVVIGAGPKALALHARAQALRDLGHESPRVLILERSAVAAHWNGDGGFTDGNPPLVTSPFFWDIGFPYRSQGVAGLDEMVARYSWHSFLVAEGRLADWVDGSRMPSHSFFASYLEWVATKSNAEIVHGEVVKGGICREGDEWRISYRLDGESALSDIRADGLVVTGPGAPTSLDDGQDEHPSITDGETFWSAKAIRDYRDLPEGNVAVIGSGDTAASIIVTLLKTVNSGVRLHIFCRKGLLFARSEEEFRWWSDPSDWHKIPPDGRREYVWRTERGVCSKVFKSRIDAAPNITLHAGVVKQARVMGGSVGISIEDYNRTSFVENYERVVVAIGFRRWAFCDLFQDQSIFPDVSAPEGGEKLDKKKERLMVERVRNDLSYNCETFETPQLFAPALSWLNCGPGFPNLGCLGILAERIIDSCLGAMNMDRVAR